MRAEKQLLLDEIKGKLEDAPAVLLTRYEVVPKRIFLKAAKAAEIAFDLTTMQGHLALVFAHGDSVTVTKVVFEFGKENGAKVEVLGGWFDGELLAAEQLKRLSKLPDQQTLRAQFLGLLEAPAAQTLAVVQSLLTSLPHLLENKKNLES